jgi:hypothetical protein
MFFVGELFEKSSPTPPQKLSNKRENESHNARIDGRRAPHDALLILQEIRRHRPPDFSEGRIEATKGIAFAIPLFLFNSLNGQALGGACELAIAKANVALAPYVYPYH